MWAALEDTFRQNKEMLEAIQETIRLDPRHLNAPEVSFLADRPALHARNIVNKPIKAERKDLED